MNVLEVSKWGIMIASLPLGPKAAFAGAMAESLITALQAKLE